MRLMILFTGLLLSVTVCPVVHAQTPGPSAFETQSGITPTPWTADALGKLAASLAFNGVHGLSWSTGPHGETVVTLDQAGMASIQICLAADMKYPGLSSPTGTKMYVTADWVEMRSINQLAYVIVHESWECGFVQANAGSAFWAWANDLAACNGSMECIVTKLGAKVACGHAMASAATSSKACADIPPECPQSPDEPCPFPQLAPYQKNEKCASAHNQRRECEKAMGIPDQTPPDVDVPNDDGFDSIPAGSHPWGNCSKGLAAVPEGVPKPMITCPAACPACG